MDIYRQKLAIVALHLALTALLAGCSQGRFDRGMAAWQGRHLDEVRAAWGEPDLTSDSGQGGIYVWYQRQQISLTPQGERAVTDISSDDYILQIQCSRMLDVDADGAVVGWRWRGNRCDLPFGEPTLADNNPASFADGLRSLNP